MAERTKIKVNKPIVDMQGDEMTRIMWSQIKEELILPYLDLPLLEYDLGIESRDKTGDEVTLQAAHATKKHGVAVKCATITPDDARVKEFGLKQKWRSPNATIRKVLGGTIFRAPIVMDSLRARVPFWTKPIIIARHAYGDQYAASEASFDKGGKFTLHFESNDGQQVIDMPLHSTQEASVFMSMHNLNSYIEDFAHSSFKYSLIVGMPLYMSTKNTILQVYDQTFCDIFQRVYHSDYESEFIKKGLWYEHRLIDDMVAQALRTDGGFVWACKNYDGDVQSDAVAQGFYSLGMMTSLLMSDKGNVVLAEAPHGTVTRHYRRYQRGEKTSTNPLASIFAWVLGLRHRGLKDSNKELQDFSDRLERACHATVASGVMTGDMAALYKGTCKGVITEEFISAIRSHLELA